MKKYFSLSELETLTLGLVTRIKTYEPEKLTLALQVRQFLIQLVITTDLYENDAYELMLEFANKGTLSLSKYDIV